MQFRLEFSGDMYEDKEDLTHQLNANKYYCALIDIRELIMNLDNLWCGTPDMLSQKQIEYFKHEFLEAVEGCEIL